MCGAVAPAAPVRYGLRLTATSRVTWLGLFQALAAGSGPDFGERNRGQGRLGFPDGVQQRHRIQLGVDYGRGQNPTLRILPTDSRRQMAVTGAW